MRRSSSSSFNIIYFLTIIIFYINTTHAFLFGGANIFGCCMVPCPPPLTLPPLALPTLAGNCECAPACAPSLPALPLPIFPTFQLPSLTIPAPAYQQASYAVPGQYDNYIQAPSSYQVPANDGRPVAQYQGGGGYGYGTSSYAAAGQANVGSGYALGAYQQTAADSGSSYNLPPNFNKVNYEVPQMGPSKYAAPPVNPPPGPPVIPQVPPQEYETAGARSKSKKFQ